MTRDIQSLLEENLAVSTEALAILKKMHAAAVRRQIFTVIKWVLIIGLTLYSIQQITPYILKFQETIQNFSNTGNFDPASFIQ